jgi:hypothetical protein
MLERLGVNPAYQHLSVTRALLIGCFGAQAVLGGLAVDAASGLEFIAPVPIIRHI